MGTKSMIFAEALLSLVGVIVGGLIGFLSAWRLWKIQTRHQRRMLAKAFLLEVQRLKPMLVGFANIYLSETSKEGEKSFSSLPPPDNHLYDSGGLYYAAQKEICFFSSDLAESLYAFYMNLTGAELARQWVQKTVVNEFRAVYTEAVWTYLLKANESIPNLEQLLAKETGMSFGISETSKTLKRRVKRGIEGIVALKSKRGDEE